MPDAFVSYAREDEPFVAALHARLIEEGKDVWIDWEDIPHSAEWWAEVEAGIEGSDAFVFVISPDSVESAICRRETEHASGLNKRFIPVLHREVDDDELPDAVAAHNWIPFTGDVDGDEAFRSLLTALETDLNWVQNHTRLLIRAREWEARGRDQSLLLRGTDLRAAEEWLASAAEKEPEPTPLHVEYALAGRKASTRRQRFTTAAVSLALLVSLALGALAFFQRQEAVRQRKEAVEQRDAAVSAALGTQAMSRIESQPDLAILLSLEGYRVSPTIEALSAGLTVIGSTRRIVAMRRVGDEPVDKIAFGDHGKTLTAADDAGLVTRWTRDRGTFAGPVGWDVDADAVALASNADVLVTGNEGGLIQPWSVRARRRLGRPLERGVPVVDLALSPDGRTVASEVAGGVVQLWSLSRRRRLGPPQRHDRYLILCLAFSPDGKRLASGGDGVRIWDVEHSRKLSEAGLAGGSVQACAFGPKSDVLAVGSEDGRVRLFDTAKLRQLGRPLVHGAPVADIVFSRDGTKLASAGEDGVVRVWDLRRRRQLTEPLRHGTDVVWRLAFSPDGTTLASAADDGTVLLWDVRAASQIARPLGRGRDAQTIAFSADGKTLVSVREADNERSQLTLWDVSSRRRLGRPLEQRGAVKDIASSPDGRLLAAAGDGGTTIWDLRSRRRLRTFADPGCTLWGVAFSPAGTAFAAGGNCGVVSLWGAAGGGPQTLRRHGDVIWDVAFSPNGRVVASAGNDGRVGLVDLRTRKMLREPRHEGDAVGGVAFVRDGTLAYAGDNGKVKLWDVEAGRQIGSALKHDSYVGSITVNPDGTTLAAAGGGTITLWDVVTRRLLGRPLRYGDADLPVVVAFSPNGTTLASAAFGSYVTLWDEVLWSRDLRVWRARLCPLVGRNLTHAEWREFLSGEPYKKTCERWPAGT